MRPLDPDELALWHAWKLASEAVVARVGRDLEESTGLSGADFAVLSRLTDLGENGLLRQQQLATSMRWDKSRLSHHLTRMEDRKLVQRESVSGNEVLLSITVVGRKLLAAARGVHARSVREQLLDRIPVSRRTSMLTLLQQLGM